MSYFRSPRIIFGRSFLKGLGSELIDTGKNAVIITGKSSAMRCIQLSDTLIEAGLNVHVWDGAESEPSIETALAGSKILAEYNPDMVIGFGGGSSIDTAKASWVFYERPDLAVSTDLEKLINPKTKLNLRQRAGFIAVPTTSGSGSEVNWAFVLTDKTNKRKIGFANREIIPDIAFLAPEFTISMPKSLTASTGLDALSHALDAYTTRQQTDFSDSFCLQAVKLIFEWLPLAYEDGNDLNAREKMQNAASLAGLGFGNSNISLTHALAHAIGSVFGISHSKAIGITLPYSLEYIVSNPSLPGIPDPRKKLSVAALITGIDNQSPEHAVHSLVHRIRDMIGTFEQPMTVREAGISKQEFYHNLEKLVALTRQDSGLLSSPCRCKEDDLKKIFQKMYSG